ncbi:MAG: hypothetical protein WCL28_03770 [bacterium]
MPSHQNFAKCQQLQRFCLLLSILFAIFHNDQAFAGLWMLRFGPPSLGTGGANPLGLPPSAVDIELSHTSESNWETSFSIVPGLLLGKRQDFGNCYVSMGGGLVISANGVGIGPYTAFGWESDGSFRYGIEYKQALGVTGTGLISPYAIRAGLGYVF